MFLRLWQPFLYSTAVLFSDESVGNSPAYVVMDGTAVLQCRSTTNKQIFDMRALGSLFDSYWIYHPPILGSLIGSTCRRKWDVSPNICHSLAQCAHGKNLAKSPNAKDKSHTFADAPNWRYIGWLSKYWVFMHYTMCVSQWYPQSGVKSDVRCCFGKSWVQVILPLLIMFNNFVFVLG